MAGKYMKIFVVNMAGKDMAKIFEAKWREERSRHNHDHSILLLSSPSTIDHRSSTTIISSSPSSSLGYHQIIRRP